MYDVVDSLNNKSTNEHNYLDKLFKFYRKREDHGKLVISTFESSNQN